MSIVVLGPLLGPGLVQRYDMAWSPLPRFTPFVLGLGTPAPRAVPSDAVAVVLGRAIGADAAQALILAGCLTLLGWGSAALLTELAPNATTVVRCATAVIAVWNPYVYERLAVGQWTVLVGAAAVPLLLRAVVRVRRGTAHLSTVFPWLVLAAVGGANSLVVALPPLLLGLLYPKPRWLAAATSLAITALLSGAWLIPSLVARPTTAHQAVDAFRPVADTALGPLGSIVSGGAFWNPVTHPTERGESLLVAGAGTLLAVGGFVAVVTLVRPTRTVAGPLITAALGTLAVVLLSVVPAADTAWRTVVTSVPGGGLLRDPQKLLAAWVVTGAVGVGVALDRIARSPRRQRLASVLSGVAVLLPLSLLPSMAWGLSGSLAPARVPEAYLLAVTTLERLNKGAPVGLLPWSQYRRYPWNADQVSLTLGPRVVRADVLYDDALPLRGERIAGEDPRSERVGAVVAAGGDVGEALRREGARYALVEQSTGQPVDPSTIGDVVFVSGAAVVVDLGAPVDVRRRPGSGAVALGWAATLVGLCAVIGASWHLIRPRIPRLLQFRA